MNEIDLNSPEIRKLAALELLKHPQSLPSKWQIIVQTNSLDHIEQLAKLLVIKADLRKIEFFDHHKEKSEWMEGSLKFLILRQAHYPLLKKLYPNLTEAKVSRLRAAICAKKPSTKYSELTPEQEAMIYKKWKNLKAMTSDLVECWVSLALDEELTSFEVSVLSNCLKE